MSPFYTEPTDADDDEMADIDQAIAFTRTTMALPSRAMRQRVGIIPLFPCCMSCITCSPLSERRKYFSGGGPIRPLFCHSSMCCHSSTSVQKRKVCQKGWGWKILSTNTPCCKTSLGCCIYHQMLPLLFGIIIHNINRQSRMPPFFIQTAGADDNETISVDVSSLTVHLWGAGVEKNAHLLCRFAWREIVSC